MSAKPVKVPGPEHPITIEQSTERVFVSVKGRVVADSRSALVLKEASYPPVYYIAREDVDLSALAKSEHTTYCPYKGDCSYYSIPIGGPRSANAAWCYENPYPAVRPIEGRLAFYPDRVDAIQIAPM